MRRLLLGFGAALAAATALACGGSSSSTPTTPSPSGGSGNPNAVTIAIVRNNGARSFDPNPATAGGRTVVFKNDDTITHRVVLNDGTIDTGDIAPGGTSRSFTMPDSGTNYHCSLHPSMVGSVSPAAGGEPPTCTGAYC